MSQASGLPERSGHAEEPESQPRRRPGCLTPEEPRSAPVWQLQPGPKGQLPGRRPASVRVTWWMPGSATTHRVFSSTLGILLHVPLLERRSKDLDPTRKGTFTSAAVPPGLKPVCTCDSLFPVPGYGPVQKLLDRSGSRPLVACPGSSAINPGTEPLHNPGPIQGAAWPSLRAQLGCGEDAPPPTGRPASPVVTAPAPGSRRSPRQR